MANASSKYPATQANHPLDLKSEIRRRAYRIYEQRGKTDGFALDDWLLAQAEFVEEFLQAQSEQMFKTGLRARARKS